MYGRVVNPLNDRTLYFITSNKGKVKEAKDKFSDIDIKIIQKDLGYPEIQADTLEEVAFFGAEHVKKKFNRPFILEDAGLFINALNGFPGVYSAYVYHKIGCDGILRLLKDFNENRNATFKSMYAYCKPNKKPIIFSGECQGMISKKEIGTLGFGFDPIFIPKGKLKTFAQMKTKEKNKISHRGKSLDKLKDFFKNP
ncbi:non-canonical purine NTP pyrophosphatase [Thermoplasmatales archaeon SG8-52-1]|nr:MAG: non-canonical purine NTP pyrophosphatase [Thermoplasmatales archaeon SG8-52-1]